MPQFRASEKLTYIARHGLSLVFHCKCGDSITSAKCKRCSMINTVKLKMRADKASYLSDFNVSKYTR